MDALELTSILKKRLVARRGAYARVAELSGLSVSWLSKFASGRKADPLLSTVFALKGALDKMDEEDSNASGADAA